MCTDCGCHSGHEVLNTHEHHHDEEHDHHSSRKISLEQDVLSKNNQYAMQNRRYFEQHRIFALNFVSSPGSGKTALLIKTIQALKDQLMIAVIEGDQQTDHDAQRIKSTGVAALQINTGKGCHLDAHAIGHAIERLKAEKESVLFIENVGNLVCPAAFDLGEAHKVVILSVTEGEDKPLKYPDMFHAADVMLLNKIDLLPYVDFDVAQCIDYARRVNPKIKIFEVSAKNSHGLQTWLQWLMVSRTLALIH